MRRWTARPRSCRSSSSTTESSRASVRRTGSPSCSTRWPICGTRCSSAVVASSSAVEMPSRRRSASPGRRARTRVHLSEDVSAFAQERLRRLGRAATEHRISVQAFPGVTVVPPGDVSPGGRCPAYRVFTPYWKRWHVTPWRRCCPRLRRSASRRSPDDAPASGPPGPHGRHAPGTFPPRRRDGGQGAAGTLAARRPRGVREPARRPRRSRAPRVCRRTSTSDASRLSRWRSGHGRRRAATPSCGSSAGATSTTSCSPAEPRIAREDLRPRQDRWRAIRRRSRRWKEGRTGYPLVDAGMRQLLAEGRCTTAHGWSRHRSSRSICTSTGVSGPRTSRSTLVDGDVANNAGNWQWVAGTGADTRPNRVFNPTRQGTAVRSGRRVRPPLGARARVDRRGRRARAVAAGPAGAGLPGAHRRTRRRSPPFPRGAAGALAPLDG